MGQVPAMRGSTALWTDDPDLTAGASALLYSTQGVARERAGRRGVRQCIRGTYPHRSGTDLTRVRHSEPAPRPCGLSVFLAPPLLCGRWPPDATAGAAERRCSTS